MSALAQLLAFLTSIPVEAPAVPHIRSIHLPTTQLHTEPVSCVTYSGRRFITGTDIIRALVFRFRVLNLPIASMKKFEEGVFSDLRNLKVGVGCQLEEPRSEFLVQLHELGCIRTQKKQKVFFWECVNHEYLFQEALGREKKRQATGAQDGLTMLDTEWRSMSSIWESHAPLKVTVHHLSMPSGMLSAAAVAMTTAWGSGSGSIDPAVLQTPSLHSSPMRTATPVARARGLLDGNRKRALSSASSGRSGNAYSLPATPMMQPSVSRSLPLSVYHLLNQANTSGGMPTPDAMLMDSAFVRSATINAAAPVKHESLWNDEAIAAVTYEVLRNSPELFSTVCGGAGDADPIVEYSNWLASESTGTSDNELSGGADSSVFSALSLIDDGAVPMQQLDASSLAGLLNTASDATLLSSLEQEIDLAATELLFAQMVQSDAKKRSRSNTTSSTSSTRSTKRFHPYPFPGSLVL